MKSCIHCGKPLPDSASFCPYCETVQGRVIRGKAPRAWRRKAFTICLFLIAFAAILIIRNVAGPKTIDAKGAELTYDGYHLILTFDGPAKEGEVAEPGEFSEDWLTAKDDSGRQSLLYAYSENDTKNARHTFEDQIASVSIETKPRADAAKMECGQPHYDMLKPYAMLAADFVYMPATETNDILWTIVLKNGDTLKLQHAFTCHEIPSVTFTANDISMETIEDLQVSLNRITEEVDPETIVYFELPAVIYQGGLIMEDRTCMLQGSEENEQKTTFTGLITITTQDPQKVQISDIRFTGEEAGIEAYAATAIFDCTFTGAKTGLAVYGGYADPHNCLFENCGTGILYNCPESTRHGNLDLDGCAFYNNDIGTHLKAVANNIMMLFNGCTFAGNNVDIRNDANTPIDTSGAAFK